MGKGASAEQVQKAGLWSKIKKLSRKQFALIIVAAGLLFYFLGVETGLFGLHIFSMFFIVSGQIAHDIAYTAGVLAIVLIIMASTVSSFKNPSQQAPTVSASQAAVEASVVAEKQQKLLEKNEKASLKRNELLKVLDASIGNVDFSFDVLFRLQDKRINWEQLEGCSVRFGENVNLANTALPPFNFDSSKLFSAITRKIPRETAKEAYNILETVYYYFDHLNLENNTEESPLNLENTKTLVLAHFLLNDLLLGTVVGDKNNKKEKHQLEITLQELAEKANFIVNPQGLWNIIDQGYTSDFESVIENSRALFREQLKLFQLDSPSQRRSPTQETPSSEHSNVPPQTESINLESIEPEGQLQNEA